ncbi:MAG: acetyl-CoA carboxylase biotin carboxylase subunit [Planctomycetota bacterium]|nr:acetyl-CoA carboxylase biotin carboxylase subunit [Planctomycetota bacterium]
MFSRVLIANRGEIALRIMRACRSLGIETVAVFSEADRTSLHVKYADKAICIGPPPANRSYLNIFNIMSAAVVSDVDAIHPGYGFLAENDHFADICRQCQIEFIGPSADTMRSLGNKAEARKLAQKIGVPVVPGSSSVLEKDEKALEIASEIGYPVMIKAASGGGGRGMRMARNDASLIQFISAARREAEASFGDPSVYLEKFITRARHIEVQIIADKYGNVVHLGDRDCTLQRRHQKLIEESPSPAIDQSQRERICADAVKLVKAANYSNAGTVEFLLDLDTNEHHFIEVNPRVQVEHPVSEMVTGIDIVRNQLRVASNERLPFSQDDITFTGHAIEMRLNAEDPYNNFAPSPGKVTLHSKPQGTGIRVDTHIFTGYNIPPNYDSLISKLIVHRETRNEAIELAKRLLDEYIIEGVKTTIPFYKSLLQSEQFRSGNYTTNFIDRNFLQL